MRPLFTRIVPNSYLTSTGHSKPVTGAGGAINLRNISKSKKTDDSSSTHQLTCDEPRASTVSGFEQNTGLHTVITSPNSGSQDEALAHGILVRSETRIDVERAI